MKNPVAKIIQIYALINGVASIFFGFILADSEAVKYYEAAFPIFMIIVGTGLVTSFGIYAFGEVIELLQGIKDNTGSGNNQSILLGTTDTELPPL